jgi:hypothetical protein
MAKTISKGISDIVLDNNPLDDLSVGVKRMAITIYKGIPDIVLDSKSS